MGVPLPSVFLNANAVRDYLDGVHGPHNVFPQHESSQKAYPQSPRQLIPSELVIEIQTEPMPTGDMVHHDTRESRIMVASYTDLNLAPPLSIPPKLYIHQPWPMHALKRQVSQGGIFAFTNSLKVFLPYHYLHVCHP